MNFCDYLNLYWHSWISEVGVLLVLSIIIFSNWKHISRLAASHMIFAAALIWLAGMVLYSIGFAYEGSGQYMLSFLLRAALASMEMFLSHDELIEVSPYYKEEGWYMVCFAVVHFAAVCLSAIVILNTVGFRLKHHFLMRFEAITSRRKSSDTYFFWDINVPSLAMAADIRRNFLDARVIFIRPTSESSIGERMEVSKMVGTGSMTKFMNVTRTIDNIKDAIVLYSSTDMGACLHKRDMRRIINNSASLSFFFLGDDEKENIKNASMVYDSKMFNKKDSLPVSIYTNGSMGGYSKVMAEHIAKSRSLGKKIEWKFIDQSYLTVAAIRRKTEYHPIFCLPASAEKGCVDTPFSAMVIGFGRTGQEMYSFFSEFSSFVTSKGERTPKNIIIVDKDINTTAGPLCIASPGIFHTGSVSLIQEQAGTVSFWRAVRQYATGINCISVALGDDAKDVAITMDLYRAILQYSEKRPKNIKIFLRVYSQENEADIKRFADDYNAHKNDTGIEIIPFGSITETYCCDVIIENDVLKAARKFNYQIDVFRGTDDGLSEIEAWKRDFDVKKLMGTYKSLPLAIDETTRHIIQLNHSSLFIGSMLALAGINVNCKEDIQRFVDLSSTRPKDSTVYAGADQETQTLMDNLARTLYERMVTSHWLMGYRPTEIDYLLNEPVEAARQKLTPLVKDWASADIQLKLMAYTLMDISFAIALEE